MKVPEYASIFGFLVVETETNKIVKDKKIRSLINRKQLIIIPVGDNKYVIATSEGVESKYTIREYKGEKSDN